EPLHAHGGGEPARLRGRRRGPPRRFGDLGSRGGRVRASRGAHALGRARGPPPRRLYSHGPAGDPVPPPRRPGLPAAHAVGGRVPRAVPRAPRRTPPRRRALGARVRAQPLLLQLREAAVPAAPAARGAPHLPRVAPAEPPPARADGSPPARVRADVPAA